jgi:D-arabinose 1-dehydrogenase-like Zn-dependent alcohol dehydrogenase
VAVENGAVSASAELPAAAEAAVFEGPGRSFSIRELAVGVPERGGAVVRISMATVCGSDVHTWSGRRPSPVPGILGHEMLGVVAALGDDPPADLRGEALRLGDRVTWSEYVPCWRCERCLRLELPQKCRRLRKYGHESTTDSPALTGGFARYCHVLAGTPVLRPLRAATDVPAGTSTGGAAPRRTVRRAECVRRYARSIASLSVAAGSAGKRARSTATRSARRPWAPCSSSSSSSSTSDVRYPCFCRYSM